MLLAIDVGNTRTKIGVWDGSQWTRIEVVQSSSEGIRGLAPDPNIDAAIFASVVPALNDVLVAALRPINVVQLCPGERWLGLKIAYDPPTSLGADRFANALGVLSHTNGDGGIAVDFGTATKIEVVSGDDEDELAYLGGCIMPGVQMMAQVLSSGTAQLPLVEIVPPSQQIGASTIESLRSGVVLGHALSVDGWIQRVKEEIVGDEFVFATGGMSEIIAPLCRTQLILKPNLTLDGLCYAARFIGMTS